MRCGRSGGLSRGAASARNRNARWNGITDHPGDVGSIVADAIEEAGLGVVEPRETNKEKPWIIGHASILNGVSICVEDWQPHDREVKPVAGRLSDSRYTLSIQFEPSA